MSIRVTKLWGHYIDLDRILSISPIGLEHVNVHGYGDVAVGIQFMFREDIILYWCPCGRVKAIPESAEREYEQLINDWQNKTGKPKYEEKKDES